MELELTMINEPSVFEPLKFKIIADINPVRFRFKG